MSDIIIGIGVLVILIVVGLIALFGRQLWRFDEYPDHREDEDK